MKKFLLAALLMSANVFATSYISLPRGGTTTVYPGPEEVVVSCLGSTNNGFCEIRPDNMNYNLYYISQNGTRISHGYVQEGARRVMADFKAHGICP